MFRVTRMSDHEVFYCNDYEDLYDRIYKESGDHYQAEEMASWAENAPYGDNWTNEEIGIDVYILEEDETE